MRVFNVNGETVNVDSEMHDRLNGLADQFYQAHNHKGQPEFDYSASSHPQEKNMYLMALTAHLYQLNIGLD